MKMIPGTIIVSLIGFLFLTNSCTPKFSSWYGSAEDVEQLPENFASIGSPTDNSDPCYKSSSYIPDTNFIDHSPVKYIKLNVHWINSSDSSKNYVGKKAIKFTHGLLRATNYDLGKNNKMWLPHNNTTPVILPRYQYVLSPRPDDPNDTGIYFHYDDELCYYVHKGKNRNLASQAIIKKYGVQLDTVLNIFIMPHHPDSVTSKTYLAVGVGVALGNSIKMAGMYENGGDFWGYRGVFNHEVGHIYGLSHTWAYNDGCDDTPKHRQNCWNRNQRPGCDTLTSNNVMDYNAMQHAWTPCQIGRVQFRMAKENTRQRRFLVPNWCKLQEEQHIFINKQVHWIGMKDLEGHLTIEKGGSLTISCRTSLPKDAEITIQPGGTLILDNCRLHNACGDEWKGIKIQQEGKEKGKLVVIGDPLIENSQHSIDL